MNLAHMSAAHGLHIPSIDRITHLDSFMTYLATIVYEWHECLYCGVEKGNAQSVQTHMRDKGHCKIDEEEAVARIAANFGVLVDAWRRARAARPA